MSYLNAKEDLLENIKRYSKTVEDIDYLHIYVKGVEIKSIGEIDNLSNITYNNDYGTQELYGAVLFKDNTWLGREEYDGSEWWEYKYIPTKEQIQQHIEAIKKWK